MAIILELLDFGNGNILTDLRARRPYLLLPQFPFSPCQNKRKSTRTDLVCLVAGTCTARDRLWSRGRSADERRMTRFETMPDFLTLALYSPVSL